MELNRVNNRIQKANQELEDQRQRLIELGFPKDVKAFLNTAYKHNLDFSISDAVMKSNEVRPTNIAQKIINEENLRLSGKVVTKLSELKNYCTAEEYHQKYLEKR